MVLLSPVSRPPPTPSAVLSHLLFPALPGLALRPSCSSFWGGGGDISGRKAGSLDDSIRPRTVLPGQVTPKWVLEKIRSVPRKTCTYAALCRSRAGPSCSKVAATPRLRI